MFRFLLLILIAAPLAIPTTSRGASTSANLAITVTKSQAITAVSLSNSSFTGGAPSGTVVGAISVSMSPATPAFSGTLTLSGSNASSFQIAGTNLETNDVLPAGTYQINIVATQAGATGSPFTAAETITGTSSQGGGDPTVGLLPSDRDAYANWKMAGLSSVGGIPNRTTQCGATINPRGGGLDDTGNINTAISNCPAGQVVQLSAGTFTIPEGSWVFLNKGITLRGAAPAGGQLQTILHRPTSGACPPTAGTGATIGCSSGGNSSSNVVLMAPVNRFVGLGTLSECTLTSDIAAGSAQANVTSSCASLFHPGDFVILDELSDYVLMQDADNPSSQIWAAPDYRVTYHIHTPSVSGDDGTDVMSQYTINSDRVTNEIKQIASVSGNLITFDSPATISYRVSHTAALWRYQNAWLQQAGLENVVAEYGDDGAIQIQFCAYCWLYQVEARYSIGPTVQMNTAFRTQIDSSYIHDAAWPSPGGAGYLIDMRYDSAELYIVNSISALGNKVMTSRGSGAGSVIAYNYVDKAYDTGQCCWQEIGLNASHLGGSIYMTYFRNQSTAIRGTFVGLDGATYNDSAHNCGTSAYSGSPLRAAAAQAYSYWFSFIGNVLGTANCTTQANGFPLNGVWNGPDFSNGIFLPGWWNGGNGINDPQTATIYPATPPLVNGVAGATCRMSGTNCATILDGNYNYWNNAISWASNDTAHTLPNSLYLPGKPAFFNAGSGYAWPWVNPTGTPQVASGPGGCGGTCSGLPAKARYDAGTPFAQP